MNCIAQVTVRRVSWEDAFRELRAIRTAVFVVEQGVPEELEWDDLDRQCLHALATSVAGEAVGTGRLLPDGQIGRMAILSPWRRRGIGSLILQELVAAAIESGHNLVELSAQTHAMEFYRRFGFQGVGGEYLEAGICHRRMQLSLVKSQPG